MLSSKTTLFATIAVALCISAAAAEDEILAIENLFNNRELQEEDEITIIDEIEEKLTWANRATSPDKGGWFKGDTYQAKSKEDKLEDLWGQIQPDVFANQPVTPLMWSDFDNMLKQKANGAFCQFSDEMKNGQKKTTHTQGVVARIGWESTGDHPYTGMFASGTHHGIMRLSETTNLHENSTGLLPSMSIKFLRDGVKSDNLFGMPNFIGTNSWNFFKEPMRNRVKPFTMDDNPVEFQTIQKKLIEGSVQPFGTAISFVGQHLSDGSELPKEEVNVPYELQYTSPFQFPDEKEMVDGEQVMFYDQLKTIPEGEVILEVWALTAPMTDQFQGEKVKIADVRLLSPLVTSTFGDTRLYFQHKRISNDRKYWAKQVRWLKEDPFFKQDDPDNMLGKIPAGVWPETDPEAKTFFMDQVSEFGCPFGWLLN